MDQGKKIPFHRLLPKNEIVKGEVPLMMAPVCETRQITIECAAVVSTSKYVNDYLQYIYEQ
jgi:hypothetical protein